MEESPNFLAQCPSQHSCVSLQVKAASHRQSKTKDRIFLSQIPLPVRVTGVYSSRRTEQTSPLHFFRTAASGTVTSRVLGLVLTKQPKQSAGTELTHPGATSSLLIYYFGATLTRRLGLQVSMASAVKPWQWTKGGWGRGCGGRGGRNLSFA